MKLFLLWYSFGVIIIITLLSFMGHFKVFIIRYLLGRLQELNYYAIIHIPQINIHFAALFNKANWFHFSIRKIKLDKVYLTKCLLANSPIIIYQVLCIFKSVRNSSPDCFISPFYNYCCEDSD